MKKIICIFLILFLTVQNVGALVMDEHFPLYGDYLFVYNPAPSVVTLSPEVNQLSSEEAVLLSEPIDFETEPLSYRIHRETELKQPLPKPEIAGVNPLEEAEVDLFSTEPAIGASISYLVYNYSTGKAVPYQKEFLYAHSGQYCNILVESNDAGEPVLSETDIQKLATEFDTNIQPFMVENFGDYYTYLGTVDVNGVLYLNPQISKIDLLIYDIQDGFNNSTKKNYYGGITDPLDFISAELGGNGNERGILHIDTYPLMGTDKEHPNVEKAYSSIVHEFQHQISFSDSMFGYFTGQTSSYINEIWWNEAFSMAAEHLYTGKPIAYRINSYNQTNNNVALRKGLVLNYNDYAQNGNNTASNYSTSYLFGQYLRTQTKTLEGGGNRIFKTVISQPYTDYRAILNALKAINYPYLPSDFATLYRNFRMATILKYPTGPYGFAGESAFNSLIDNAYTGTATLSLNPNAAVVLRNPRNFTLPAGSPLRCMAFSHRGIYSYELHAAGKNKVNVTHGNQLQCGVTLFAVGYDENGRMLGMDKYSVSSDQEEYTYILPEETVTQKFFLWAADDNQKPLAIPAVQQK